MPTNLSQLGFAGPFSGLINGNSASFYRLDPTFRVPVEPIADIVPSVTPNRVVLDMIDAEVYNQTYEVTRLPIQDFGDITPNIYKNLIELQITGTLVSSGPLLPAPPFTPGAPPPPPTFGFRFDMLRYSQLETMADRQVPIMVVTPRVSINTAFITGLSRPWTPADGESTVCTITLLEARVTSAAFATTSVSGDLNTGNTSAQGGGSSGGQAVNPSVSESPPVNQVPPVMDNSIGAVPP